MAELAGVSTSGAYKIIAGDGGMPTEAVLRSLAVVLGLEPAVLWDAAAHDHKPVDDVWSAFAARIKEAAQEMTPTERRALRDRLVMLAHWETQER